MNKHDKVWKKETLVRLQGGKCFLCREPVRFPSFEHVVPRYLGGSYALTNLAVTCRVCNNVRHAAPPTVEMRVEHMVMIASGIAELTCTTTLWGWQGMQKPDLVAGHLGLDCGLETVYRRSFDFVPTATLHERAAT